jgi:hypothetical protein
MRLQLLLPVMAILLAVPLLGKSNFTVVNSPLSPLRLTLLASVLVYLHGMLLHRHPYFGIAGALCLCFAGLGESPEAMKANTITIGDKSISTVWMLVPRTVAQWGLVSVISSFLLLGAGMAVSLLGSAQHEVDEPET